MIEARTWLRAYNRAGRRADVVAGMTAARRIAFSLAEAIA